MSTELNERLDKAIRALSNIRRVFINSQILVGVVEGTGPGTSRLSDSCYGELRHIYLEASVTFDALTSTSGTISE